MGSKRSKIAPKNEAFEIVMRQGAEETGWKKERLLVLEGELEIIEVAKLLGCHRNNINDWIKLIRNDGFEVLLTRGVGSGS